MVAEVGKGAIPLLLHCLRTRQQDRQQASAVISRRLLGGRRCRLPQALADANREPDEEGLAE